MSASEFESVKGSSRPPRVLNIAVEEEMPVTPRTGLNLSNAKSESRRAQADVNDGSGVGVEEGAVHVRDDLDALLAVRQWRC